MIGPLAGAGSVGDATNFSSGSYWLYNAPFNAGALQPGIDYADVTTYNTNSFPNGTRISWRWPSGSLPCNSICGFMEQQWGFAQNTDVPTPIASKQISGINTLVQTVGLQFGGVLDGFDAIDDIFTTSTTKGATQVTEIEVFLHSNSSAIAFVNGHTQLANFTDRYGRVWQAAYTGTNLVFMPVNRVDVSGPVDLKAMLQYMVAQGRMAGTEWFNGFQMGSEPIHDSGFMNISDVTYAYN